MDLNPPMDCEPDVMRELSPPPPFDGYYDDSTMPYDTQTMDYVKSESESQINVYSDKSESEAACTHFVTQSLVKTKNGTSHAPNKERLIETESESQNKAEDDPCAEPLDLSLQLEPVSSELPRYPMKQDPISSQPVFPGWRRQNRGMVENPGLVEKRRTSAGREVQAAVLEEFHVEEDSPTSDSKNIPDKVESVLAEAHRRRFPSLRSLGMDYACETCQKRFPTPLKLRNHMACHVLKKSFVCETCGRGFARKQTLTRHIMHRHVTEKPHVCPVCKKGYPQKYLLKQHVLKHTPEEQALFSLTCQLTDTLKDDSSTLCSSGTDEVKHDSIIANNDFDGKNKFVNNESECTEDDSSKPTLESQEKVSPSKPYVCSVCNMKFADKVMLDQHMINHSVGNPYKCNLCDTEFVLHRSLVKHCMTVHLGDRPFVCEVCDQAFGKTSTLKRHMLTHSKVKPHVCSVCSRAFTREYSLQLHMANHTGEKPFKCQTCGKGFASNSRLTMHFRSQHVEIAQYACGECGMTFAQEGNLQRHVAKKHSDQDSAGKGGSSHEEGEHICKICSKVFTAENALNRHLLMHSLERPFVCEICDRRFTAQIGLTQHMFIHAEDNPYTCQECGKGFTHRKGLEGHMMLHTGEKPHPCDLCPESFRRYDSLRRHKIRDHSQSSTENDLRTLFKVKSKPGKRDITKYFGKGPATHSSDSNSSGKSSTSKSCKTKDQNGTVCKTADYLNPALPLDSTNDSTDVAESLTDYVRKKIEACEKDLAETIANSRPEHVRQSLVKFLARTKSNSNSSSPPLPVTETHTEQGEVTDDWRS